MAKSSAQLDAEIAEVVHGRAKESRRTQAQDRALHHALKHGQIFAGWNPGGMRTPANVLRALERAGLLKVSRTSANELVGTLTQAGAIAAHSTKES